MIDEECFEGYVLKSDKGFICGEQNHEGFELYYTLDPIDADRFDCIVKANNAIDCIREEANFRDDLTPIKIKISWELGEETQN